MKNVQNLVLILLSLYTVESIKLTPSKKKRPSPAPEALKEDKTEWDYSKTPGYVLTPTDAGYVADNADQNQYFEYTAPIPEYCMEIEAQKKTMNQWRRLWILTTNTSCQRACKSFQGGEHWVGKYACDPFVHCGPEVNGCAPWKTLGCLNMALRAATNNKLAHCASTIASDVTVGPPSTFVDEQNDDVQAEDHGASRPFVKGIPCSMKKKAGDWCTTSRHNYGQEHSSDTATERKIAHTSSPGDEQYMDTEPGYYVPMKYSDGPTQLAGNDYIEGTVDSTATTNLADGMIDVFMPGTQKCIPVPDPNCHVCVSQSNGKADMCTFEHWSMKGAAHSTSGRDGNGKARGDKVLCPCIEKIPDGLYDDDNDASFASGPWWGGRSSTTTTTTFTSTTTTTTTLACSSCKFLCQENSCMGGSLTQSQFNQCIYGSSGQNIPCRQCYSCATLLTTCPRDDADFTSCMAEYFQAESYDDVCSCD